MGKQGSQFSGFTSQAKGGSSKSIKHNLKLKFIIMDMFFFLLLLFCSYHRDKLLWTFFSLLDIGFNDDVSEALAAVRSDEDEKIWLVFVNSP